MWKLIESGMWKGWECKKKRGAEGQRALVTKSPAVYRLCSSRSVLELLAGEAMRRPAVGNVRLRRGRLHVRHSAGRGPQPNARDRMPLSDAIQQTMCLGGCLSIMFLIAEPDHPLLSLSALRRLAFSYHSQQPLSTPSYITAVICILSSPSTTEPRTTDVKPGPRLSDEIISSLHLHLSSSRRRSLSRQASSSPAAENRHDAKANIEQSERVCNQAAHAAHAADSAEHGAAAVRAPHDRRRRQNVAKRTVHGHDDANQRRQHQRQQAVSQDGCGARESQRRGEVRGRGGVRGVAGRGRSGRIDWRRHEGEDHVEGGAAEQRETVNVAEMHLAGLFILSANYAA